MAGKRFRYYQPNSNGECADCVVRSVSKALRKEWLETYDLLTSRGRSLLKMPNDKDTYRSVLEENGFVYHGISNKKGSKRPTVSEFAGKHKGVAVLNVANHLVTVEDGYYWDIWDCGHKSLYGYWDKEG